MVGRNQEVLEEIGPGTIIRLLSELRVVILKPVG
jgi:hypothetical protein